MSRRRRHRTNADRIETALRMVAFCAGMALLGAFWIYDLARGRS